MRALVVFIALVAPVALAAPLDREAISEEVRDAFHRFEANLNRGDYTAALTFYADDPRFIAYEDGQTRYRSHAALADAFEQLPAFGKGVFRYADVEVLVLDADHAQIATTFFTAFGEAGSPGYFQFEGVLTAVVARLAGEWQMLTIHSSTRRPR
ncbi:MAG: nuclear transport factor 2 family protein [Pseudomonadota bacterium]